jgi:hypothetical protein
MTSGPIELELGLIQPQMSQKPVLLGEVGARALRNREEERVGGWYIQGRLHEYLGAGLGAPVIQRRVGKCELRGDPVFLRDQPPPARRTSQSALGGPVSSASDPMIAIPFKGPIASFYFPLAPRVGRYSACRPASRSRRVVACPKTKRRRGNFRTPRGPTHAPPTTPGLRQLKPSPDTLMAGPRGVQQGARGAARGANLVTNSRPGGAKKRNFVVVG